MQSTPPDAVPHEMIKCLPCLVTIDVGLLPAAKRTLMDLCRLLFRSAHH